VVSDGSPKGTGGCAPPSPSLRATGVWDAAAERHDAQDEFHSAAHARAWADGDFDADHSLGLVEGVGCSAS
jgi:hypothetical protein